MRKFYKLARSARSHILHTFSQCKCFVGILSFILLSYYKTSDNESALIEYYVYAGVIWDLKINVFERKYLNYQQNDEGNKSFRLWKCQNNLSSLAYSCFWGARSRNITAASIHFSDGGGGAAKVEKCPPPTKIGALRAQSRNITFLKFCMFSGIFMLSLMVL